MPIYEFACGKCGREFEEIAFGDETVACPHCGSHDTRKMMSCCARRTRSRNAGFDGAAPTSSGSGCGGCSGGNCASCGH